MLKDVFGSAEHQAHGTYALVYRLTLTRNNDYSVFNTANATNNVKIKTSGIECYVTIYTSSMKQPKKIS